MAFHAAEVGVSPGGDLVPQRLKRAGRPAGRRKLVAQRRGDCVAKVGNGASEELPARLEFSPETEESERVVARNVHAVAELVQQRVERASAIERQTAEPRRHEL